MVKEFRGGGKGVCCVCVCVCVCVCCVVCVCVYVQRRPGRTQLRWIDILNRDLFELPNWQDVVKDQAKW